MQVPERLPPSTNSGRAGTCICRITKRERPDLTDEGLDLSSAIGSPSMLGLGAEPIEADETMAGATGTLVGLTASTYAEDWGVPFCTVLPGATFRCASFKLRRRAGKSPLAVLKGPLVDRAPKSHRLLLAVLASDPTIRPLLARVATHLRELTVDVIDQLAARPRGATPPRDVSRVLGGVGPAQRLACVWRAASAKMVALEGEDWPTAVVSRLTPDQIAHALEEPLSLLVRLCPLGGGAHRDGPLSPLVVLRLVESVMQRHQPQLPAYAPGRIEAHARAQLTEQRTARRSAWCDLEALVRATTRSIVETRPNALGGTVSLDASVMRHLREGKSRELLVRLDSEGSAVVGPVEAEQAERRTVGALISVWRTAGKLSAPLVTLQRARSGLGNPLLVARVGNLTPAQRLALEHAISDGFGVIVGGAAARLDMVLATLCEVFKILGNAPMTCCATEAAARLLRLRVPTATIHSWEKRDNCHQTGGRRVIVVWGAHEWGEEEFHDLLTFVRHSVQPTHLLVLGDPHAPPSPRANGALLRELLAARVGKIAVVGDVAAAPDWSNVALLTAARAVARVFMPEVPLAGTGPLCRVHCSTVRQAVLDRAAVCSRYAGANPEAERPAISVVGEKAVEALRGLVLENGFTSQLIVDARSAHLAYGEVLHVALVLSGRTRRADVYAALAAARRTCTILEVGAHTLSSIMARGEPARRFSRLGIELRRAVRYYMAPHAHPDPPRPNAPAATASRRKRSVTEAPDEEGAPDPTPWRPRIDADALWRSASSLG